MIRSVVAPLCAAILSLVLLASCDSGPEPAKQPTTSVQQPKAASKPRATIPDRKTGNRVKDLVLLDHILKDYRQNHTYMDGDVYDCDNMAKDVWNILRTKGFRAKLAGGNVDKNVMKSTDTYLMEASHAWVMAELAPGDWMAMECTGGYLVPRDRNPLYYTSAIFFNDPTDMGNFVDTLKQAKSACTEFNTLVRGWNKAIAGKGYKPGSKTDQTLNQIKGFMDAKEMDCDKATTKLRVAIMTKRKL